MIYLFDSAYSSGITAETVETVFTANTIKPRAWIFRGRGLNNSGNLTDDAKFGEHKKLAEARGTPWGAYMVPVYPLGNGKDYKDFWVQASDYMTLITAGGGRTIPPIVDVEQIPGAALPAAATYRSQLRGAVEHIYSRVHYWPILYSNYSFFNDYLQTGTNADGKWFADRCPLWIASPRTTPLMPSGWARWALWQFALDVHDFKGAADVDLDRWPGTYAEFLAWCKAPSIESVPAYDPVEDGSTTPEPPPDDGGDQGGTVDLTAVLARLDQIEAAVNHPAWLA